MAEKGVGEWPGMSICSAAGTAACTPAPPPDVARRLREHQNGTGAKYTRARPPVSLAYTEEASDRSAAQRREAAIKKLPRKRKLALIEGGTP